MPAIHFTEPQRRWLLAYATMFGPAWLRVLLECEDPAHRGLKST